MGVLGIHHVTAVSSDIVGNQAFYTGTLGLRLVKKSVNQDDVKAYHLFYADAIASPGTDMTFFDWPDIGPNSPGAGTTALTSFRVPTASLEWWERRLTEAGLYVEEGETPSGLTSVRFSDPEGQRLELVGSDAPTNVQPWTGTVPVEHATRGFHGLALESARPDGTHRVLTELLGLQTNKDGIYRVEGDPGTPEIALLVPMERRLGRVGAGGVHHVAFRVRDDEQLREMQEKIESAGLSTSGYVDRFYFHSLYFREPGGVLFELATDGPGMHADEPMESLGERIALPPFLEERRGEIEAGLRPLPPPAYLTQ